MYNKLLENYIPEVLIVDDIPENIQVLAGILKDQNYEISVANSGKQAIEAISQDPPDIILLDISMPDMDGIEACLKIKEIEKAQNIPIIFITALSDKENIIAGFDAGAVDYITKPFNPKELLKRVKTHLALKISNDHMHKQNEELKNLNYTKDRFFSIIAHDLKNPFNSLLGFTELLLSQYDKFTEEKKKQYVEIINDAAKKGFQLLENLLYWSRSQLNNIKLNQHYFSLNQVIIQEINSLKVQMLSKEINIEFDTSEDLRVFADENTIALVVRNLISNAVKYSHKNSKIELKLFNKDNFVAFSVHDFGVGIEKEKIEKLFSFEEMVSTSGTNQETGTGLGLMISKEFIEKNGGKLTVESEAGMGSIFTFTLPKQNFNEVK